MISADVFFIFKVLNFQVVKGVKGQKMVQNDKKNLPVARHISVTIHHMIIICGTQG